MVTTTKHRLSAHIKLLAVAATAAFLTPALNVQAQQPFPTIAELISLEKLKAELTAQGKSIPTGAGIRVGIVEGYGSIELGNYLPNASDSQFTGKVITDRTLSGTSPIASSHATTALRYFVGNQSSVSPGVTQVDAFSASDFFNSYLSPSVNRAIEAKVLNHSYIMTTANATVQTLDMLNAWMDNVVNRDQVTNIVSLNNGSATPTPEVYASSYNSIVVGRTDGNHSSGDTTRMVSGRTKPDIVAPNNAVSFAAPLVASTAAMLHSVAAAENMSDADRPEVMKAILMAGADKNAIGFATEWSNSSTRPLDANYGAGELDVYNSYKILTAGQHDGTLTFETSPNELAGWDFGSIQAGQNLFWNFEIGNGMTATEVSILLTWNAQYPGLALNAGNIAFTLANMRLSLYNAQDLLNPLWVSDSAIDNVEHIYLRDLTAGNYAFSVSSNSSSTFAIAWNVSAVPEPSSIACLSCTFGLIGFRWYRGRRKSDPTNV